MMVVIVEFELRAGAESEFETALKHMQDQVKKGDFPNLEHWFKTMEQRPAVARAYKIGASINSTPTVTEESRGILLGQDYRAVAAPARIY